MTENHVERDDKAREKGIGADDENPADTPGAGDQADGRGAEIGISDGEGSSFEPEEDPEAHD